MTKTRTTTSTRLKIALGGAIVGITALAALAAYTLVRQETQELAAPQAVSVPITVEELLPSGVSGWNRTNAVATFGIPLAQDANVTDVNQLGLTGATAAQFREIRRWPNGSLQWVLVDAFVPTLAAGQQTTVSLTNGTGSFPAGNLATDSTTITVNTGVAQFAVRKSGFNVIDSATVNARQFLTTGPKDGVWSVDDAGKRYTSANDPAPVVRIDENGPVRTVIRADGTLTATDGAKHFDYTLRLHFTRNSSRVKLDLTVRNAESSDLGKKLVAGLGVQIPTNLTTSPQYTLPTNDGTFSGALGGNNATLFQAFARNAIDGDYGSMVGPSVGTQTGVEVKLGENVLHALGNNQHWGTGWARMNDSTGAAVTVAMNHLSEFWPGGFALAPNGTADIHLYSPSNAANPLSFTWGAHDTRTLAVDFASTTPPAGDLTLAAVQYPLFGRGSDYAYYGTTGAIFGATRLVTESEYDQFITATDQAFGQSVQCRPLRDAMLANENKATVWRAKDWGRTGGPNQLDKSVAYYLDYLRTGKGGMFLRAYEESRYKSDQAAVHCDDCDLQETWPNENPNNWPWGDKTGGFNGGGVSGNIYESNRNHPHWPSILLTWMLTGDQTFYDDTRETADFLAYRENGMYGARNRDVSTLGFGSGGLRGWPNALRDHALFAEYLNVQREWDAVRFMSNQLVSSTDRGGCSNGTKYDGWNKERGFLYSQGHMGCPAGRGNSFYHQHFVPLGTWEAIRVLQDSGQSDDQALAARLSDFLLGHAEFVTSEIDKYARVAGNGSQDGWRTPYRISYDYPNPVNAVGTPETYHRADYLPSEYSWAYEQTGNTLFLEAGQGMFCRMLQYEPYERGSDLASQEFIWTWLNRQQLEGGLITPTVQAAGAGQWTLRWTAPANAVSYEIRSSDKLIVEHGYFDEQRTDPNALYLYPPTQYAPYWDAAVVNVSLTPQPGGSAEQITVSAPAGHQYFTVQYRTSGGSTDTTPPVIANLQPTSPVQAGASFRFGLNTNEPATCKYGTQLSEAYELKPFYFRFTGTTVHRSSSLPNVAPGTYTYAIRCKDAAGNVSPTDTTLTFTVQQGADTTPPQVIDTQPVGTLPAGTTSATLQSTTNEIAVCRFGPAPDVTFDSQPNAFSTTDGIHHDAPLSGLQNGQSYTYFMRCRDAAGNTMTADAVVQFSVASPSGDTTPPVISGITATNVTDTSATISWTTDEPADSQTFYGLTTSYGSSTVLDPALVTSHSQPLSGLTANTLYHYRVQSRDASGNLGTSTDQTFTTGAEPPGGSALYRIDFGKNVGVTIPDWEEVTLANLAFDAIRGWGFVGDTSHIDAKERIYGDNVTKDYFVRSTSFSGPNDVTKQFKVVVANGTYQVTITRGDAQYGADNIQNPFHYPMIVRENSGFEGQVPRSVLTRNPDSSYPVESETFTITVSDGALDFTFTTDGICTPANDCGWGMNALEIVPVVTSCTDGTALNACSVTKPNYCDANGSLINRCSQCGCPSGNSCQADGSCVPTPPKKKHWYDILF